MAQSFTGLKAACALLLGSSGRHKNKLDSEQKSVKVGLLLRAGLRKPELSLLVKKGYIQMVGGEGAGPKQLE
jgi:hypothetical protein